MKGIRVLLVGTHELTRGRVQNMLEQEEDIEIIGDCSSAEEALLRIETLSPNIILMDTKMPGMAGIEATRRLLHEGTPCNVIMLNTYEDDVAKAVEAGAAGYLLENIKCQELVHAIRRVYHGELVIDERLISASQAIEGESEYLLPEGSDSGTLVREAELIIPPPFDVARLLRFIYQVEGALDATIAQQVGSWDEGTAVTLMLQRATPLVDILDRLGKMPDVESAGKKPVGKYKSFSSHKATIARLETRPREELLVTLKQADTAKEEVLSEASSPL